MRQPCISHRLPAIRLGLTFLFSLSLLVAAIPARGGEVGATDPPKEEKTLLSSAPDFTVTGLDGKTYALRELLKKGPVVLDFWTTWCKPCMQELPHLEKIWEKHRDSGFTFLGIPSDDQKTAAKIKPKVQSMGFKFPNAPDPDRRLGSLYNVRNYPTTVLIAPDGKIARYRLGYNAGDEVELEAKIVGLLKAKAAGGETR